MNIRSDTASAAPLKDEPVERLFDRATLERADLVIMGMYPPPVTGAAKNTLGLLLEMQERGKDVAGLETGVHASALKRSGSYHLARLRRFADTLRKLRRIGRKSARPPLVYTIPDGGLGLWYSLGQLLTARKRARKLILHHRTCKYVDATAPAMQKICDKLGKDVAHVFLSEGMRDRFFARYGKAEAIISTNARYVDPRLVRSKSDDRLVIGHLSNLCTAKGFYDAIATFEAGLAAGLPLELHLAGPVVEDAVQARLDQLLQDHPDAVTYHGPLFGEAKDRFYDLVHVFLFPTRWEQEAQPNVIYEAYAGGAAVISFERGCISEMIPRELGITVSQDTCFEDAAVDWLKDFWSAPERVQALPAMVRDHIEAERALSRQQHHHLLQVLAG